MPTLATVTVKSSGGDYTSLQAALQGEDRDITAATGTDEIVRFDCYPFEDTANAILGTLNWVTSATNYVELRFVDAAGDPFYTKTWSTDGYRLMGTDTVFAPGGANGIDHLWHTEGTFQCMDDGGTGDNFGIFEIRPGSGGFARFDGGGIMISNHGGADDEDDWRMVKMDSASAGSTVRFRNWIFMDQAGAQPSHSFGVEMNSSAAVTVELDNCTFDTGGNSLLVMQGTDNDFTLRNVRATGFGTIISTGSAPSVEINAASDHNLTDATSNIPANWGSNSFDGNDTPTIDYVDSVNADPTLRDYTPEGSDTGIEAGGDLSGTFTLDIAGETRTDPWDIGAVEASLAATPPAAPTGVTTLRLSWADDGGVSSHRIYFRETGSGDPWTLALTVDPGVTETPVWMDGSTPLVEHDYAVSSYDAVNDVESAPVLASGAQARVTHTPLTE